MPSNTPNLNLYKKNPATDGDDTFNIETMLNENFDKIDAHAGDNTRHIMTAERDTWNAKETTVGAQTKANAARDAAINTAALDATTKANAARDAAKAASIPIGQKGAAGGVADLDASGKVPRDKTYNSLGGQGGITNLNTAFTAGIWTISPDATGSPEPSGYGILENIVSNAEVYNGSSNWIIQIVRMLDGDVFSRIKVNQGVWGPWNLEGGVGVFKTKGIVGTDYNEYIHPGTYQIYGNIPANAPPLTAPWGILNVYMGSNGYIVQEATQTTTSYGKWYRTRIETEWGPWLNIAVQNRAAIFDGVDARSAENFRLATDAPSTYPGGETTFFVNNSPGWPAVYGTVVSVRGNDRVGATAVTQYFYPYNISAPIKYRQALYSSDTWGEWKTVLTNSDAVGYAKTGRYVTFGGTDTGVTTPEFITMLKNMGAHSPEGGYWVGRGDWSYATNVHITDTGLGLIHLAGAVVEVIGSLNSDHYTIRITTPTTNAVDADTNSSEFIYVNNGVGYYPAWRKSLNSANTSGLFGVGQTVGNANTLVHNGSYVVAASWTGSLWAGADGANQGYLTHTSWNADNSYAVQTFMPINTTDVGRNGMWYRRKIAGAWGTWTRVYSAENDIGIFKERGIVPAGSDLNDYNGNGSYMLLSDYYASYVHRPPVDSYYVLTVSRAAGGGGFVKQTATQVFGSFEYYRTRTDQGIWSSWVEVMTSESGNSFVSRSLPSSGEDLNNKTALGMYVLGASNDYVNGPGLDWCLLNVYRNSSGYMVQEATNVGSDTPRKRFRTRTEANYWSRWTDVVTTDATGKIPGVAANRVAINGVPLTTTASTTVATYTIPTTGMYTVKICLHVSNQRDVAINVNYAGMGGSKSRVVLPYLTTMAPDDWDFIPVTILCNAGSNINVVAQTSIANSVYITATITQEG